MNDDLFPHRSARAIRQVVDLVKNHDAQVRERGASVHHVARHLRRHDDDGSARVDGRIARGQADVVGPKKIAQLEVLLIRQGFDRGRVESALAVFERKEGAELANDCLAGAGGCRNEDRVARLKGVKGLELEGVGSKTQAFDPFGAQRRSGPTMITEGRVALGGTTLPHAGRLRVGRAVASVAAVPASWWAHGDSSCIQTDNMCCARLAASPRLSGSTPRR